MAVIPFEKRSYPGAAADTVLNGGISSSALGFDVAVGTGNGFPDGTEGPFFVVIDYDNTSTEKVHCIGRVGDAFTVDVRGADATTALSHADQAKVRACWTATDAQEANAASHGTIGLVTAKGDMLSGSTGTTLVKTAVGTAGQVWTADPTVVGGISWQALPEDLAIVGGTVDATTVIDGVAASTIIADLATIATLQSDVTAIDAFQTALGSPLVGSSTTPLSATGTGFLTIPLTNGTWMVTVSVSISTDGGSAVTGTGTVVANPASGTTLTGKTASTYVDLGVTTSDLVLTFEAVVTTNGHVSIATGATMTNATVCEHGATSYTAYKVA